MRHDPVGADIDPVFHRIAGDVEGPGANITPAVFGMPQRRREREHVDVVAFHDVFHHRTGLHLLVWDGVLDDFLEGGVERLAELELVQMSGKAERDVLALATEEISEHAMALGKAGDLVKQRRRRGFAVLQQLGREPDILIPGSTIDAPQLTELVDFFDIVAKIGIGNVVLQIADLRAIHRGFLLIFRIMGPK